MSHSNTSKSLFQSLLEAREKYKGVQTRDELENVDRRVKALLEELAKSDPTFSSRREGALRRTVMEIQDFMAPYESKIKTAVNKAKAEGKKALAEATMEKNRKTPSPSTVTFPIDPSYVCKPPKKS